MRHSYSKSSKKPFGTYTAHSMFRSKYRYSQIEILNKPFYENLEYPLGSKQSLYAVISRSVYLNDRDRDAILEYAAKGNQVFISAEYVDAQLLDTLDLNVQYVAMNSLFQQVDTAGPMRQTSVTVHRQDSMKAASYGFFYLPFEAHFVRPDESNALVLGTNDEGSPNYISVVHGNGRFFFHLNPEAFSNYYLLSGQNKKYAEEVFSYLPAERKTVYWDDYYRIGRSPNKNFSLFDVFLENLILKWALLMSLLLLLLYIAFASKRRQRAIPIKPVNSNASISFVETIGRLYLQKKDNQNIAHKMTTYFLEHIRARYYLNTAHLNAEFFSSLSRKSGVDETEVKQFFQFIQQLQEESHEVTDTELLEYNNRMQQFFTNKYEIRSTRYG
ncbi:DUF4350 domain-containing protein [Lacibacter sediminis]|uniref:DUF4350 domain-containing protein n=1 Tax=Lacibacter sediminis TaxID=2760713 RepID=A0A7G5XB78_9BACT|nr:DUF4350 domain-containing protein [Lacibacter sediminis]QNA42731.1 DUF4350 domain-containing protein [Lacibacter sediminis]